MIAGIDPDTYKLTFAVVSDEPHPGERPEIHVVEIRPKKDVGYMPALLALRGLIPALAASTVPWPSLSMIWIERGYGMSRSADFGLGAVIGATLATIPWFTKAEVNPIDGREWRKAATGNGNCPSEDVPGHLTAVGVEMPEHYDKDVVDAIGVAVGGRLLNLRASGLA